VLISLDKSWRLVRHPSWLVVFQGAVSNFIQDQGHEVFQDLPMQIELQSEKLEISVVFSIVGIILVFGAIGLSTLWRRFP
jgi:hypothetical protein